MNKKTINKFGLQHRRGNSLIYDYIKNEYGDVNPEWKFYNKKSGWILKLFNINEMFFLWFRVITPLKLCSPSEIKHVILFLIALWPK